jgi:multidrug resistance efflux pump
MLEKGTMARKEDIEAQEAEFRVLEGRLAEASLQLGDSTLRAPYDGVIAQRFAEERQTIIANKPVVTFQNVDDIDIVADVPEAAMAAGIRSAATIMFGLAFACVLTMIVVPVLYAIFFGVHENAATSPVPAS